MKYNYKEATSRNIGWISEAEQASLQHKKIAIAGMGGVGGAHLITLARLGISNFHIADFDAFEVANFNRQIGATMQTIDQQKVDVLTDQAKQINPEIHIKTFKSGINEDNIDAFLNNVDVFVDGFDFFVLDIRAKVFKRCHELAIPCVTAAPIGMGTAYLIFMPGQMTFEQYFRLEGAELTQQYVNFAIGLTPKGFHRDYLIDPTRLDLMGKKGPSTIIAVNLCAGIMGAEVLKILTGRGKIYAAPYYHQFDAFKNQWKMGRLFNGNGHPLQKLKCKMGYHFFKKISEQSPHATALFQPQSKIEKILDLARWAPSGDNAQPWRFSIKSKTTFLIFIQKNPKNIYEFNHCQPTFLSIGFLVESIRIAASRFGDNIQWDYDEATEQVRIQLVAEEKAQDHLASWLPVRSVLRTAFKTTKLSPSKKQAITQALGEHLNIRWFSSLSQRWQFATTNAISTDIRLRLKSAYHVHHDLLHWDEIYSPQGIPSKAIGLDKMTEKSMQWVMQSWSRVDFMNRFLAGTLMPRIQLDWLPGLMCSDHFVITWKDDKPKGPKDWIETGQSLQRFWLTATQQGLSMQPGLAPLSFATYGKQGKTLETDSITQKAKQLAERVEQMAGKLENIAFMGRIGEKQANPHARSIRQQLPDLMQPDQTTE